MDMAPALLAQVLREKSAETEQHIARIRDMIATVSRREGLSATTVLTLGRELAEYRARAAVFAELAQAFSPSPEGGP